MLEDAKALLDEARQSVDKAVAMRHTPAHDRASHAPVRVPAGATRVNVSGKTIVPGFINAPEVGFSGDRVYACN